MGRKPNNRRNMTNNQSPKNRQKTVSCGAINHDDFDDFIDQMLIDDKSSEEDRVDDTPICHVY